MRLYSYWRSTTSYRVRIALHLKGVAFETVPMDLLKGAQREASYLAVNPAAGVPALELADGTVLTQSMAILEWLEAVFPEPALLPADPVAAARVRAAACVLATEVHPVNNLRVVMRLRQMGLTDQDARDWMRHWMSAGLQAFQALLPRARFCFGDAPGLADICLVAQLYNAHRWAVDMAPFGRLTEIEARCLARPAFAAARPERQPDAD